MTDDQHDIIAILVKYALREPLQETEQRTLEEWRRRSDEHAALPEHFRDRHWLEEQRKQLHTPPTETMWEDIRQYIDESGDPAPAVVMRTKRRIGLIWYPVAVVLLAGLLYGGMRFRRGRLREEFISQAATINYKLLLTLDDGSLLVLDTLKKGAIIAEGRIRIRKTDSNSYVYSIGNLEEPAARHRLSLAPAAGVARVQWPDGSNAWLKPGTSVDYAVDLRSAPVQIEGEAWFRIAPDAQRPVTVAMAGGALVRVLGTSFDVRSQPGVGGNWVALFTGGVRVVNGADSVVLRPGWEAETGDARIRTGAIDSNAVLAWMRPAVKSPELNFADADLLQMMPAIAAWYRVQVVNPQGLRGGKITGSFLRNMPLATLIDELRQIEDKYVRIDLREDTILIAPLKPAIKN